MYSSSLDVHLFFYCSGEQDMYRENENETVGVTRRLETIHHNVSMRNELKTRRKNKDGRATRREC